MLIGIWGVSKKFKVAKKQWLKCLKNIPTGKNTFSCLSETIVDLNVNQLSAVTTNGTKNMIGYLLVIFVNFCKKGIRKPSNFHCIFHQQALCRKFLGADSVIYVIITTLYYIRKTGLNHRQLKSVLEIFAAEYGDLLYHTKVR